MQPAPSATVGAQLEALASWEGAEVVDDLRALRAIAGEARHCPSGHRDSPWLAAVQANGRHAWSEALEALAPVWGREVDPGRRGLAHLEAAVACVGLGRLDDAIDHAGAGQQAIQGLELPLLRAELLAQQAVAFRQQGLTDRALQAYLQAMSSVDGLATEAARELGATLQNNLAVVYLGHGDPEMGAMHLRRGIALADDFPSLQRAFQTNLGMVLLDLQRVDEAEAVLEAVLDASAPTEEVLAMRVRDGLARVRLEQGRWREALVLLEPTMAFWESRGFALPLAASCLARGRALDAGEDAVGARACLERGVALAREHGFLDVEHRGVGLLARWHRAQGDFEAACTHFEALQTLGERRHDRLRTRHVEELRVRHDMASHERTERSLRTRGAELERLVAERTEALWRRHAELREATQLAEAASRAKSAFLAVTGHELRTPIHAITGYVELLLDDLGEGHVPPVADLVADLGHVHEAAMTLLRHVDRILALTDLESGRREVRSRTVDVGPWLGRTLEDLVAKAQAKGSRVDIRVPAEVRWEIDDGLMADAVRQLVDNAVRFTEQGTVTVRVAGPEEPPAVWVKDTGEGLPPDVLEALFQPFQQLDMSTTRLHGGLGLGLALVRREVALLGGHLEATSTLGAGTTFVIRLAA